jgi:hypothetical protein
MLGAWYGTDGRNQKIVVYIYIYICIYIYILLFIIMSVACRLAVFVLCTIYEEQECLYKEKSLILSLCNGPAGPNTFENCDDVATHVI